MKLLRTRAQGGKYIRVPKELEPFALYLLNAGYNEITVAGVIQHLETILRRGLTEEDLERMNPNTRRKYRHAWRRYGEWLKKK